MAKFKKGNSGRKKGAVGKITKTVKEAFLYTFNELQGTPKHNLLSWAKRSPTKFYELASKLIPMEIKADVKTTVVDNIIGFTIKVADENNTDKTKPETESGTSKVIG